MLSNKVKEVSDNYGFKVNNNDDFVNLLDKTIKFRLIKNNYKNSERDRMIMFSRHEIDSNEFCTYKELGKRFGISSDRARHCAIDLLDWMKWVNDNDR